MHMRVTRQPLVRSREGRPLDGAIQRKEYDETAAAEYDDRTEHGEEQKPLQCCTGERPGLDDRAEVMAADQLRQCRDDERRWCTDAQRADPRGEPRERASEGQPPDGEPRTHRGPDAGGLVHARQQRCLVEHMRERGAGNAGPHGDQPAQTHRAERTGALLHLHDRSAR